MNDDTPAPPSDNDALIGEVVTFLTARMSAESDNRGYALDDLLFLKGDAQWPDQVRRMRELEGRPCLTINTLPTFLHQVTNDQRQNKPGIKVHPVDDQADPETAKVLQGLIRHIEYASNADVAYDTAVNSAAACGFGYYRLITDYCSPDSFDQDIKFKRIRNQFTVYPGPHVEPDGSDMMACAISEDVPRAEFKRQYPNSNAANDNLPRGLGDRYAGWIGEQTVRVVEYYRVELKSATLVRLADGTAVYEDQMPEGAQVAVDANGKRITRSTEKRVVRWYKVTGADVLEQADIPCNWIPVFPVYGDELDIEGKVYRSGVIRNAKDPARMYNFWMTSATEEVALRPKVPYIGAEGQFEGHEATWAQANNRSFAYLEYKPTSIGGQLAPPPQRTHMADVPVGTLQMAMHARDNIKATTGIFDASLGAKSNETSGRAILARQKEGDVSNFHYTDNLARTIRHTGRCLLWMIPRVYDTPRVVRILGEDETVSGAPINTPVPEDQQKPDPQTGAVQTVLNDLSVGQYDVTVTMGPSYTTLRQEAADAMVQFGQSWPKLMDIAGDKVVKAMDWPGAEEIAERIERTIPPEIRGEEAEQPQLPPQAQAAMQQMQGYIGQLEQALQEANSGLEKARIDAASRERVAEINAVSKADVAELQGWVQLLVKNMQPPPLLTADVASDITEDDNGPAQAGSVASGGQQFAPEPDQLGANAQGQGLPMGTNTGPEPMQ